MSSIEELQKRVSDAEQRFGLIKAQRAKYSERLVGLIDAIEARLHDQRTEIERQAAEIAAQAEELETNRGAVAENQALRGMLHSLLQAIETGGRDVLNETMQAMDAKVSTIIQSHVKEVPALSHAGMDAIEAELGTFEAAEESEAHELEAPALESAELEASEPVSADIESPEPQGDELDSAAPEGFDPENAALEPGVESDAAPEMEPAADSVTEAEEPQAIEDELPEAMAAAADEIEILAEEGPAAEEEPAAEAELASSDEIVSEDRVEAVADMDALDALDAPGEDDALAALDPAPEEMPTEAPEPELEASDEEALAAEEAPVEAEATEPEAAEMAEPQPEPEATEFAAEAEFTDTDAEIGGAGTLEGLEDPGEAATLEEIMRRVSKLVEEEGTLGKPTRGSVRIGAESSAEKPKAASNG